MTTKPSGLFIISLLGALSVISPFAIDLYLPSYPQVAEYFGVPNAMIALTLSSYFIGMAFGQLLYGPLLDRFGRKMPLCCGLVIFIIASLGCAVAPTIELFIALRFIQAVGGCAAGVASLAMVHDFFPAKDGARILSRLFLFIAVSPLLAPSVGSFIALTVGWQAVFYLLAIIVAAIIALIFFKLPEGHTPDATISLKPLPIMREYWAICKNPHFITYALSGAFSFAGLFIFVAGSPIIFMENFHLSAKTFSGIFAMLAFGFIGGSQLNVVLLKKFSSEILFFRLVSLQSVIGIMFMVGMYLGWYGLTGTLALFFLFLATTGITYPNAAALAIGRFSKNAGSAAALLGFLQMGVGALISSSISMGNSHESFPIIAMLAISSLVGFAILLVGRRTLADCPALAD